MPKYQQDIPLPGSDKDSTLAIAYETFKNLGWPVMYAGDDRLIGGTPKSWTKKDQQIITSFENGSLIVQSVMINSESFDLTGINKKNTAAFTNTFENTKQRISREEIEINKSLVNNLRQQTAIVTAQQQKDADEIKAAMKPASSNTYITYCLIAINVLVFILMIVDGAALMIPDSNLIYLKWGADFGPLTLSGDYWRLVSNMFIHFGAIHLVMNMYCLYIIGSYLEPMLGKVKFTAAYFCTGILASIVSLWWHKDPSVSAGASGAIFGMYGLFFALLTTDLIPQSVRKALLKSIGIFILYNLVYGMKSGVDNSAHIGGLISGFVIGYLYVINIRAEKKELSAKWVLPAVLVLTAGISVIYLQQNKAPVSERQAIITEINEGSHKDDDAFRSKLTEFSTEDENAIKPLKADALLNDTLKQQLTDISLPAWDKAETIVHQMQQMDVGDVSHKKADLLLHYISLRKEEVNDVLGMINNEPGAREKHDSIITQINLLTEQNK